MKEDRVEEINQTEPSPNNVELQFPKVKTGIKAGPEIDIRPKRGKWSMRVKTGIKAGDDIAVPHP